MKRAWMVGAALAAVVLVAVLLGREDEGDVAVGGAPPAPTANVAMIDGKQRIDITAKGDYSPRFSVAQAGVPTVLQINTSQTIDCTIEVAIPRLRYRTVLPATGVTAVDLPPQAPGTTLQGVCWMGMYSFSIRFV